MKFRSNSSPVDWRMYISLRTPYMAEIREIPGRLLLHFPHNPVPLLPMLASEIRHLGEFNEFE